MSLPNPSMRTATRTSLVCAAASLLVLAGMSSTASAAFVLIDNFESGYTLDANMNGVNGWVTDATGSPYSVAIDPDDAGNQVLKFSGTGSDKNARKSFANAIADNTTGTLFLRVRFEKNVNNLLNANFGLTDQETTTSSNFDPFNAQLSFDNNARLKGRDGGGAEDLKNGSAMADVVSEWYNVWVVVDGTADTYKVFVQSDFDADFLTQTELFGNGTTNDPLNFRTTSNLNAAIDNLYFRAQNGVIYWDDFYIDNTGSNFGNPVPEPASLVLAGLGGLLVLGRRRQS